MDSLQDWSVSARAVRSTQQALSEVSLPALAHMKDGPGGRFVVLVEAGPKVVQYVDPARGWITEGTTDFSERWSGILLLVRPESGAGASDFLSRRRAERLEALRVPVLGSLGALSLVLLLLSWPSPPDGLRGILLALAGVKVLGAFASAGLLLISAVPDRSAAKRLCPAGRVLCIASAGR